MQNFQLSALPVAPTLTQTDRQPPTVFTQPTVGPMGSTLKVFDGTQFVAIAAGNTPPPDRMTVRCSSVVKIFAPSRRAEAEL